jgi:hypothetical protein
MDVVLIAVGVYLVAGLVAYLVVLPILRAGRTTDAAAGHDDQWLARLDLRKRKRQGTREIRSANGRRAKRTATTRVGGR